ncbi:MAG: hypothetical protein ACRDNX_06670 [Gaiellaceae bacterium]
MVVLFLALLLVLLVFHTLEHGLEEGTLLTCFAVLVFLTVRLAVSRVGASAGRIVPMLRGPPRGPMAAAPTRLHLPPGASPLRL